MFCSGDSRCHRSTSHPASNARANQTVKAEKFFAAKDNGLVGRKLRRLTLRQQTIVLNLLLI
jgi:hypothetical protein